MDEPFSALDELTKDTLRLRLLDLWDRHRKTIVFVTHSAFEAVLLSDRIVMMTNGPAATIGEILEVDLERPRNRLELADDPRFRTNADRVKNNELIVGILQAEVAKRSTADWMATLEAEGIPAGPVLHHDQVFADPQILARDMVAEVEHAKAGRQKTLGVPLKMSATPASVRRAAPTLGQHDTEVRKARRPARTKGGK